MRILIGHFSHESNSFSPFPSRREEFDFYEGKDVIQKIPGAHVFLEAGAELVPTIYAARGPSGTVTEDAYLYFENKILDVVRREKDNLDGIFFQMHGAMNVENIGSGEYRLMRDIRDIVGDKMPIAAAMDLHSNNDNDLPNLLNIMRGFRSAPHIDVVENQEIVARELLRYIGRGEVYHPAMERLPMILVGEKAIDAREPLKTIFAHLWELEKQEEIAIATMYVCMAWTDTPRTTTTVAITPSAACYADYARKAARELAAYIWEKRDQFDYGALALPAEGSVARALEEPAGPVFICDSGDNPSAGSSGVNTVMLKALTDADLGGKKAIIASIYDGKAYEYLLKNHKPGDTVSLSIGANIDEDSTPVAVTGTLLRFGEIMGEQVGKLIKRGNMALLSCGDVDICVADEHMSFTGMEYFESIGVNPRDYHIVVLKQGYLFPDFLPMATLNIWALTPGNTHLEIRDEDYKLLPRPIYPLDPDAELTF